KMRVINDLKAETFEKEVQAAVEEDSIVVMDNLRGHVGVEKVVKNPERQTVPGKNAPKVLPWVHIAIANAKSLFQDMYHGIKDEFLQGYLDEFCYKFNRKYFGDRVFDRLVIAGAASRPTFVHSLYLYNKGTCGNSG
ncbi:MAG: transposase, partial [Bacteroidales bacterium]|nr:transposase [Bacteroidales bacterium]